MSKEPEVSHLPLKAESFRTYLHPETNPPLDVNALSLDLLQGTQRKRLRVITDGDWSLLLSYRRKESYVASFAEIDEDTGTSLKMTQLQGATRGKGYRVISGIDVLGLFTDQIKTIA